MNVPIQLTYPLRLTSLFSTLKNVEKHKSKMKRIGLLLLTFFYAISSYSAIKSDESNISNYSIWDFNSDGNIDTIYVQISNDIGYKPLYINWGRQDESTSDKILNSTIERTRIHYPEWKNLKVSFTPLDVNDDAVIDMVFAINGTLVDQQTKIDTSLTIVVFGHDKISKIETIELDHIVNYQINPFHARILKLGDGFTEPKSRDASGQRSYQLQKIKMYSENEVVISENITENESDSKIGLEIFPNPVNEFLNISINNSSPGNYTLRVMTLQGIQIQTYDIECKGSNESARLDISHIIDGCYIIRLDQGNKIESIKTIIIIH